MLKNKFSARGILRCFREIIKAKSKAFQSNIPNGENDMSNKNSSKSKSPIKAQSPAVQDNKNDKPMKKNSSEKKDEFSE